MKRGLRCFGHPVHPMLTHLPVGLLTTSPAWEAAGLFTGHASWWTVGFWVTAVGVATSVPAAVTGVIELLALSEEHRARDVAIGGWHGGHLVYREGIGRIGP